MKEEQQTPICKQLPASTLEPVRLERDFSSKRRVFAAFLICCALLVAAFAITVLWQKNGGLDWFQHPDPGENQNLSNGETGGSDKNPAHQDPMPPLPEGAIPVVSMDLIGAAQGSLINETGLLPDLASLMGYDVGYRGDSDAPLVLILHTHTSESYLPPATSYVQGTVGDLIYSEDVTKNLLSVGARLCEVLNENGISALHCSMVHDADGRRGSYARSAETIQRYLSEYPSIEYVIDLHRDLVIAPNGDIVRSEGKHGEESVAQVAAIVGSDEGNDFWQSNLALALQLQKQLNADGNRIARPTVLQSGTLNQELAKFSLHLEIGTAANSPKEAERAAELVGEALIGLIRQE